MTETAQQIIAKTEALVRITVDLGHLCTLRRWHDPSWCMEVFQCDAAKWLADQERYGHTVHSRQMVSDEQIASAVDPVFLYADAGYYVVRDALLAIDLWDAVSAEQRRNAMTAWRD